MATGRTSDGEANLDRRRFIRKAAVAGGTVWAVPTLVSMRPASAAELTSAPPEATTASTDPPVASTTEPPRPATTTMAPDGPTGSGPAGSGPAGSGGSGSPGPESSSASGPQTAGEDLARTGADIDKLTVTGLAAVATGGALTYWSANRARQLVPAQEAAAAGPPPPGNDA